MVKFVGQGISADDVHAAFYSLLDKFMIHIQDAESSVQVDRCSESVAGTKCCPSCLLCVMLRLELAGSLLFQQCFSWQDDP